jgi:hypothetical protein
MAAVLYGAKVFGNVLSIQTLVILAIESAFLVPLAWEKAKLGDVLAPHLTKGRAALDDVLRKIPRASHVAKKE